MKNEIKEGLIVKGGVNERPTSPPPEPPKGQGGSMDYKNTVRCPVCAQVILTIEDVMDHWKCFQNPSQSPTKLKCKKCKEEIQKAWDKYNKIEGEYTYHLEEGGDTDITQEDVAEAWEVIDTLIKRL